MQPRLSKNNDEAWIDFENGEQLRIDFFAEPYRYFQRQHRGKNELLAKAIGTPKGLKDVWDATLGLAEDAVFLSLLGCRVRASERNPLLFELLQRAFLKAGADSQLQKYTQQIIIYSGDSQKLLAALDETERPQVVYLDPMFPERKKSALPRKEMRLFRSLVGEDPDADLLFQTAMQTATERVVVKRPLRAPELAPGVIHRFEGQTVRYDLYRPKERS